MKFNKKLNNLSFDNKILIACLSIATVTLVFFFINKQTNRENMVGAAFGSEGPFDFTGSVASYAAADAILTQANNDINTAEIISTVVTEATITDTIVETTAQVTDELMIANDIYAEEERLREAQLTRKSQNIADIGTKAVDGANKIVSIAATGADIAASQAQRKADNARDILTYYNQADWNKQSVGTMGAFSSFGLLGFLAASGVGMWAITNINVLIYRITNFKSCFIWYFLELIGWIIYLPIQFIVWLFCLQEFEKNCWLGLDAIDCSIHDYTGYYLFKHSDDVNQRCYSQVFTPFPKLTIPFSFDSLGNYMNNFDNVTDNLTSNYDNPDQVVEDAEKAVSDAQKASEAADAAQIAAQTLEATQIATETAIAMMP